MEVYRLAPRGESPQRGLRGPRGAEGAPLPPPEGLPPGRPAGRDVKVRGPGLPAGFGPPVFAGLRLTVLGFFLLVLPGV